MTFPDFVEAYQWSFRPQHPRRPEWFTGGLAAPGWR